MIYRFSKKIVKDMVDSNIVKLDDYEIYLYGFQSIISTIVDITSILIISTFIGQTSTAAVFLIFFCSLRLNAGGYHASSYLKCLLFISSMTFISIGLVRYLDFTTSIYFIASALIFSLVLVIKYAPVDTPNKPLNNNEKKACRQRTLLTFFIEGTIVLSMYFIHSIPAYYCSIAVLAIFFESTLLLPINKIKIYKER